MSEPRPTPEQVEAIRTAHFPEGAAERLGTCPVCTLLARIDYMTEMIELLTGEIDALEALEAENTKLREWVSDDIVGQIQYAADRLRRLPRPVLHNGVPMIDSRDVEWIARELDAILGEESEDE